MQGHTTLSTGTEDDLNSINKGAELMMRRNSRISNSPKLKKRRNMEQAVLALSITVGILIPVSYTHLTLPTICSV